MKKNKARRINGAFQACKKCQQVDGIVVLIAILWLITIKFEQVFCIGSKISINLMYLLGFFMLLFCALVVAYSLGKGMVSRELEATKEVAVEYAITVEKHKRHVATLQRRIDKATK